MHVGVRDTESGIRKAMREAAVDDDCTTAFVVTTPEEGSLHKKLKKIGFKEVRKFRRRGACSDGYGEMLTIWMIDLPDYDDACSEDDYGDGW